MIAMPMAGTSQKTAIAASTMFSTMREGRSRKRRFRGDVVTGNDAA